MGTDYWSFKHRHTTRFGGRNTTENIIKRTFRSRATERDQVKLKRCRSRATAPEKCKGKKTLIFNNGINTSWYVYQTFKDAGYEIKHLDNTHNKKERKEILKWFREKPDAILTSVSILTTGFDEPTVENIILNRATKSLTLYFQMIGRGSRKLPNKDTFNVIDLGNNIARFGPWNASVDWQLIF